MEITEWCDQFPGVLREGATDYFCRTWNNKRVSRRTKVRELWMEKRRRSIQSRENHPRKDAEKPKESSHSPTGDRQTRIDK